jgi:enterochelin esterase-like enzyme
VAGPVKNWVDATYRTLPERDTTAIAGSSHGGLAAFWTGFTYPSRFGFVGALSPSFWVGAPSPRHATQPLRDSALVRRLGEAMGERARRPRVWIDWGLRGDGAIRSAQAMAALLESDYGYVRGRELDVVEDAEGAHDERTWARRLPAMLEAWLARKP